MLKQSFGNHLTYSMAAGADSELLGAVTHGVVASVVVTVHEQGTIESTGRALDFAIEGNGYFTLELEDGGVGLTRDGRFNLDQEGFLTDSYGNRVLGENGAITAFRNRTYLGFSGKVVCRRGVCRRVKDYGVEDDAALVKQSNNIYTGAEGGDGFTGSITQGALEKSNVDMTTEMTDMISSSRNFQACAKLVTTMDDIMAKTFR
jgi:flagellar basal body rod protein FlgG